MRIPNDELDHLLDEASRAIPYNDTVYNKISNAFDTLKEAQELIEKFEPLVYGERYGDDLCVYCQHRSHVGPRHDTDCPYAIRKKLGYGQKEPVQEDTEPTTGELIAEDIKED